MHVGLSGSWRAPTKLPRCPGARDVKGSRWEPARSQRLAPVSAKDTILMSFCTKTIGMTSRVGGYASFRLACRWNMPCREGGGPVHAARRTHSFVLLIRCRRLSKTSINLASVYRADSCPCLSRNRHGNPFSRAPRMRMATTIQVRRRACWSGAAAQALSAATCMCSHISAPCRAV